MSQYANTLSNKIRLFVLVVLTASSLSTTTARTDRISRIKKNSSQQTRPVLENKSVLMIFDEQNGNICSFTDKQTGTELLSARDNAWKTTFGLEYTQKKKREMIWTDNCRAQEFSYKIRRGAEASELRGTWRYHLDSGEANVFLTVTLPSNSSSSQWQIRVNVRGNVNLERVTIPVLSGIGRLGDSGQDDRLLVPDRNGRLFSNPFEKLKWWGQPYPCAFVNMQFMAYYDKQAGFFLSSLDKRGLSKSLLWDNWDRESKKGKKWAAMKIVYRGLSSTGNAKSFQTEAVLGVFHGDWTTAASIYRDWALQQPWAKATIKNKGTPTWLTNIGIGKQYISYDLNRDTKVYKNKWKNYDDWASKISEHQKFFSVPTEAELTGWEHGGTWASGDYFPPQEGWEAFDRAVRQVRSSDAYPLLLIRAESIRWNAPAWESSWAQRAALRDVNDQPVGAQDKQMCFESDEWLAHLKEVTITLAQHGVCAIQLDGFPWTPLKTCYSRNHNHEEVPGCATRPYKVADNLLKLRFELRSAYPDVALAGEGGAEFYMPVLDIYNSRECWADAEDKNLRNGLAKIIPLFQFVYHQNIIFVGSYNLGMWDFLGGSKYHGLAVGRCFVWGEVCSYNMQDWLAEQGNQPIFGLLKRCAKARIGYLKDFLVFGRMLPPTDVEAPLMEVASENKKFQGKVPSVLASAWQSEEGDVAIIVLNIGEQILKTSLSLSPYMQYIHPGCKMEIYLNNDLAKTTTFDQNYQEQTLELEPLQFKAFIFKR